MKKQQAARSKQQASSSKHQAARTLMEEELVLTLVLVA
jgi:hypothetical protein